MSQQWDYRTVKLDKTDESAVNAALTKWAAEGWELVNGSYADAGGTYFHPVVWLFWRRAR
jgi:hypothetical protein